MRSQLNIKQKDLLLLLNGTIFLILFFFKPLLKYWEYTFNGARLNFAAIMIGLISINLTTLFILFLWNYLQGKFIYKDEKGQFLPIVFLLFLLAYLLVVPWFFLKGILDFSNLNGFLEAYSSSSISYLIFTILGGFLIFLIDVSKWKKIIWFVWMIQSWIYLASAFSNSEGFEIILNDQPIYLLLSDAYSLLALLVLYFTKSTRNKLLVFIFSGIILYILLSRVTIALFLLIGILHLIKKSKLMFLLFLCCFAAFVVIPKNTLEDAYSDTNNRVVRLLAKGSEDSSLKKRKVLMNEGLVNLKEAWLFGDFMGDLRIHNEKGKYIHNYLSFWSAFGIFPFILLLILTGLIVWKVTVYYLLSEDNETELLFLIFVFYLGEIILARGYNNAYIWLAIGMFFGMRIKKVANQYLLKING